MILTANPSYEEELIPVPETAKKIKCPLGVLLFDEADAISKSDNNTIFVDKDLLNFPLTVRKWKNGDYFYPFGMKGKKKLSKYFKDEKLSLLAKEKVLLLCSSENVVWVLGKRQDNRFKVTKNTKHILKLTLGE